MSSNEVAIRIKNIGKCYQIYDNPSDRLKQFILPRLQRLVGKTSEKYFREFWSLKNISFEVAKGETIGVVGRNGSGKSTLLQIICGTLNPTQGEIQINGRVAALLELGSGFNPEFTGRENVYMNALVLGLSKEEVDKQFNKIIEFADIGEFIEQPVKTYSSGMMVRLAFAVIAHVNADILIVDEALSVGDAFFTQKCMRFLRDFMKNGTVLFVSHDTAAVVNLCNSAVLLNKGEVAEIGTPKDITEHYLATLYESIQSIDGTSRKSISDEESSSDIDSEYTDMREKLINSSNLRNDIEVFNFNPNEAEFGTGKAKITSVSLLNKNGNPLSWIVGGEEVILNIQCMAKEKIDSPIIGFQFKDRLGQVIFSDNTYLSHIDNTIPINAGSIAVAQFHFRLPVLPSGDYTVSSAIAEGTQDSHVQHHWLHDALLVRVHASSACFGLIGLSMKKISLEAR